MMPPAQSDRDIAAEIGKQVAPGGLAISLSEKHWGNILHNQPFVATLQSGIEKHILDQVREIAARQVLKAIARQRLEDGLLTASITLIPEPDRNSHEIAISCHKKIGGLAEAFVNTAIAWKIYEKFLQTATERISLPTSSDRQLVSRIGKPAQTYAQRSMLRNVAVDCNDSLWRFLADKSARHVLPFATPDADRQCMAQIGKLGALAVLTETAEALAQDEWMLLAPALPPMMLLEKGDDEDGHPGPS
jgi:hypothetical protein